MTASSADWVRAGEGRRPKQVWSFAADAPLVALQLARETGEVLAADAVGGLYLIGRDGQLAGLTRGPSPLRAIAWGDTGTGGIALVGDEKLYWFDRKLNFLGSLEQSEPILGIAVEAHGRYAAASLSSGINVLYDMHRKPVRRFQSVQPLTTLEFLVNEPAILAVSEYGMLCCHEFTGVQRWQSQLWANVGDLSISGDGQTILLACYSHGIQCHDASGAQVGSYQVGGTVFRASASFASNRIAAATLERHFYYLNDSGQVQWQATLPEDLCRVVCDPLGTGVVCGFQSGRIVRLEWE